MRQALILVGGRGTRLGEHARDLPKPLVHIAGHKRFLDYVLENLARHGVGEIVLLAGHKAAIVTDCYHNTSVRGASVRVVVEPEAAGTAGALRHAADMLDDAFLLLNGDTYFDMNFLALATHLAPNDVGVLALRQVPDGARYGRVELNGDRIAAFREKDVALPGAALVSAGVYALRRSVLDFVAQTPCSIESDVFPELAKLGLLGGVEHQGFFIDIGLPETLAEARGTFPDRMRRAAILFDRDGTLIRDNGYTHKLDDLDWQPGAIEAVRTANDSGALAIVVTNQAGVARGLYSEADMHRFHEHMQAMLARHGAHIDAFYHCPFHGDGIVAEYALANHPDRKPNPGMLRRALTEWPIDRARAVVVGDADTDIAAGAALGIAGCRAAGDLQAIAEHVLTMLPPARPSLTTVIVALKNRAASAKRWWFDHALPTWWERGYDRYAHCFHERLALDGAPVSNLPRRIRVQARQTAVYARAGKHGWHGPWREAVGAGVQLLLAKGVRSDGGTNHLLSPSGDIMDARRDLYDAAFVTFALAEAAGALGDAKLAATSAELAAWVRLHWAHPEGGFHEGEITPSPPRRQNPHMHMFEALLALHERDANAGHLDQASKIARLLANKLIDAKSGALPEYFDDGWRPQAGEIGGTCEPGHHFEWSWLLHRWNALGGGDLSVAAERLRVHGEIYGVEPSSGAVFDEVLLNGMPKTQTSRLWPHTERIKASLARFERTHDIEAANAAIQAYDTLMRYCDVQTPGLWRDRRLLDGRFLEEAAPASSFYHLALAVSELIRVSERLEPQ